MTSGDDFVLTRYEDRLYRFYPEGSMWTQRHCTDSTWTRIDEKHVPNSVRSNATLVING